MVEVCVTPSFAYCLLRFPISLPIASSGLISTRASGVHPRSRLSRDHPRQQGIQQPFTSALKNLTSLAFPFFSKIVTDNTLHLQG